MRTSYLDVPRIHFKGRYRADINSRNNCQCNFDIHQAIDQGKEWNYKGSCEWEFIDTYVTSVIDENGQEVADSPLLGRQILGSEEAPLAKLVDFDVDHQIPTLYGFKFRMRVNGEMVLSGNWTTAVLVRDMWTRVKCGSVKYYDAVGAAMSTSTITDIQCHEAVGSLNLCQAWNTTKLAVSVSLSFFSGDVFTVGNVVGTIGVAKDGEPLNVGGDRNLESTGQPLQVCPDAEPVPDAVNIAPFSYSADRKKVTLDISNAFSTDNDTNVIDVGDLWLGVLQDGVVTTIGEPLPYLDPDIWNQGGVIEYRVHEELEGMVENAPIVVVKEVSSDSSGEHTYPHRELLPTLQQQGSKVMVLLQESEYFVRPMDHYHRRLEYENRDYESVEMTLLVTSFGKPADKTSVRVDPTFAIPPDGVVAMETTKQTNSSGLVVFTFKANQSIPSPRLYNHDPCNRPDYCPEAKLSRILLPHRTNQTPILHQLPIEGQMYHFCYSVDDGRNQNVSCDEIFPDVMTSKILSFRSSSTIFYDRPYTWVDHIGPIFKQVHHLHYIMSAVLDMSSYKEVTQPYNIKLIRTALRRDINDAGYMPVSRDLSPSKIRMIIEWLDRPCFSLLDCETLIDRCQTPPSKSRIMPEGEYERCGLARIPSKSHPQRFFKQIYMDKEDPTFVLRAEHPPRPLFGYGSEEEIKEAFSLTTIIPLVPLCDIEGLKLQLQLAVQLEFATIPLYLTSLYTIMDHCNVEAYAVMRNIIVQEMLHFAQAANTLIAIGGEVKIDSEDVVPHYPTTGLPGGVLPNLTLTLEKFTMKHLYENFMALEVPAYTTVPKPQEHWNTIGQFYSEIQLCMVALGEGSFETPRADMQVEWPWDTPTDVGTLYKVTNLESAKRAIEQIVEQGEGASAHSPVDQSTKQYAHFFRFEEIFCENKLEKAPDGESYSYTGDPIPYNPNGVWNMKDSLSVLDIEEGTVCHTQATVFHRVYRKFLRVLQDTFSGHPERVNESLQLMEVLKVHAKRTIWAPLISYEVRPTEEGEITCGPIWDYEWNK